MNPKTRALLNCNNEILDKYEEGVECSHPEIVIMNIIDAFGLIGNGSFQYFFECEANSDKLKPDEIAESLRTIGENAAAEIMLAAKNLFPGGIPMKDWKERLKYMQDRTEDFDRLGSQIMALEDQVDESLFNYASVVFRK